MKRAIVLSLLILPVLAARSNDDDWRQEDRETIHKSFHVASGDNVAKFTMMIGAQGNLRSRTVRAWPEAEYLKLVSELP